MMLIKLLVLIAALKGLSAVNYGPEALLDEVTSLPGLIDSINFRHFSGYLTLPASTKHMHYWMVESTNDPSSDPIAFWTNGGPGCSGMLGFLTEQGPFRPNKDLSLSLNDYSWNKVATMVFIEAPCGVGFSYSDNEDVDYHTDDTQTASDNYDMIQAFLTRFPAFSSNELYITSESYGGHYMPTLAKVIVDKNTAGLNPLLNFKGFFLGNPATTVYSAIPASMDTYWGHQLVSKPLWDQYTASCKTPKTFNFEKCEYIFLLAYGEVARSLNPYALDYPTCVDSSAKGTLSRKGRSQRTWLINHLLDGSLLAENHSSSFISSLKQQLGLQPVDGYEPCEEDYMTSYLNQAAVKTAIHVKEDIDWVDCSRTLRYRQTDGLHSMTSYYNYLLDGNYGLKIVVYSGDDDDVCATIGTQSWIWDLGYKPSAAMTWQPYTVSDQTAGYMTKYSDVEFAFVTVHAAGHEVPTYKPDVALYLWTAYLQGQLTNKRLKLIA
eukprot:gene13840-18563_t